MNFNTIKNYLNVVFGVKRDDVFAFRLVSKLANKVMPSYRLTWPELAWFQDAKVVNVLSRFEENNGFNAHRRYALQQLIRLTDEVDGDTAECGVYKGCGSYIVLQSNTSSLRHRTHHIFDSFEGLSVPTDNDGKYWLPNDLSINEVEVRNNLFEFSNVKLHKGWIPKCFNEIEDKKFSFVHVDVDLYQPTFDSISFFYDKMNDGGIFVCDDFGFLTCPGATKAIQEYLSCKPEKMIGLSGGGGFFIKGCGTSAE